MLKELIEPQLLWRELKLKVDAFTADTQFEGGFKVNSLFAHGRTAECFTLQDVSTFGRVIRDMRNALSHGRDQKSGTTIMPTTSNLAKFQPWIAPVRLVARQVIHYKSVF